MEPRGTEAEPVYPYSLISDRPKHLPATHDAASPGAGAEHSSPARRSKRGPAPANGGTSTVTGN